MISFTYIVQALLIIIQLYIQSITMIILHCFLDLLLKYQLLIETLQSTGVVGPYLQLISASYMQYGGVLLLLSACLYWKCVTFAWGRFIVKSHFRLCCLQCLINIIVSYMSFRSMILDLYTPNCNMINKLNKCLLILFILALCGWHRQSSCERAGLTQLWSDFESQLGHQIIVSVN